MSVPPLFTFSNAAFAA